MSSEHPHSTASARDYAKAYATHYSQRDLLAALGFYGDVIELHPESDEAEYSRSQMRNIVKAVVPAQELLDSQLELVRRHLSRVDGDEPVRPTDTRRS